MPRPVLQVRVEPRWAAPLLPFNLKFRDGTLWPTEESGFTPQVDNIRKFVEAQGGESTRAEVGAHLGLQDDALRKALKRAKDANAIVIVGDEVRLPEFHEQVVADQESVFTGD